MKDTVSKQCEHYKVDRGPHARLHSSLRANTVVHHLVPVLSSQDLGEKNPQHHTQKIIHKTILSITTQLSYNLHICYNVVPLEITFPVYCYSL